jgi:hypothetical protein
MKGIDDYNAKKPPGLITAVSVYDALEDEEDFIDSFKRVYRIK